MFNKRPHGMGRGMRKFVSDWYLKKDPYDLALEVFRIKSRHKWSHADMIKTARVRTQDPAISAVLKAVVSTVLMLKASLPNSWLMPKFGNMRYLGCLCEWFSLDYVPWLREGSCLTLAHLSWRKCFWVSKTRWQKSDEATKTLNEDVGTLRKRVECPVCLEIPRSGPVFVCKNGHFVCQKCKRGGNCPTCREVMRL